MNQKYCKYCNEEILYDPSPIAEWAHKTVWGFFYYCEKNTLNQRHQPLTNLDYLEQKYAEQQRL